MKLFYVTLVCLLSHLANAQLLSEDFSSITVGNFLGNGWTQCSATTTSAQIGNVNLIYPNYFTANTTNALQTALPAGVSNLGGYCKTFTSTNASKTYAAFLLKVDQIAWSSTSGQYFFTLGESNISNGASVYFKRLSTSSYQLGIRKETGLDTYSATPLSTGTTNLIVVKYEKVTGSNNDIVSLYINPTVGQPEPTASVSANTAGADFTLPLQNVFIRLNQVSSQIPPLTLDAINVDTTWNGVLSAGSPITCNVQASYTYSSSGLAINVNNNSTGTYTSCQWDFGNGTGSNALSNAQATYTQPGTYNVCLYLYNTTKLCDSICQSISVNYPAGLTSGQAQECNMSCNGRQIILNTASLSNGVLYVYNLNGQLVFQQNKQTKIGNTDINLPTLPAGVYMLRWISNKGMTTLKTQL